MGRSLGLVLATTLASHGANQGASAQNTTDYVRLEMYAAVSSDNPRWIVSEFGNENMYDAAGLVRYLMTDVLPERGHNYGRTSRNGGIEHILRYHMRVLNPAGATFSASSGEFAQHVNFVDGQATDDISRFTITGDEVGIQDFRPQGRMPSGISIPADLRFAFEGVYYSFSLGGPCPNLADHQKGMSPSLHEGCIRYASGPRIGEFVEGVLCTHGDLLPGSNTEEMPYGLPGCSVVVDDVETATLDQIAGIVQEDCGGRFCRDWADFHMNCTDTSLWFEHEGRIYCREFDPAEGCQHSCLSAQCQAQDDLGIEFWRGRCNPAKNAERARALVAAFSPLDPSHYATNPPCSRLPHCGTPVPREGSGYCHRDESGVCDLCFVPGTVQPPGSRQPGVQPCRLDLFNGRLPQYQDRFPTCASSCGSTCSDATESDLCCLYIGQCTRDWQVSDWGQCTAECGLGMQWRSVSCPFQEFIGPCNESSRPGAVQDCFLRSC